MTNAVAVCLVSLAFFCCTNPSWARQVPKECSKGPSYWCQSLKTAAECGAVGHCIGTVWETQKHAIESINEASDKFIKLFSELKEVREMINVDYLSTRVSSACQDAPQHLVSKCVENTENMSEYLYHVLMSDTPATEMCWIIGMCNKNTLEAILKKPEPTVEPKPLLVGTKHCTWGPSYWCSNFTTSRECKAMPHCVKRVWSHIDFTEDKDDICKICTDMVKQARDQLESNETQEELKEVFEGSCKLIPIKLVRKGCIELADDFVPELVETLASQMNPQQVCSVAGLCNNAKIDKLLDRYSIQMKLREECNSCHMAVGVLRKKFDASTDDDFLVGMLRMCREAGSFSDSCSMLVFKYFDNIKELLKKDLTPRSTCHLSGQCAHQFHSHDEFTFPEVDFNQLTANDDVPCEFCEKLVIHLRDVLTANTTELEFKKIMTGLCKQSGQFKAECLQLVDQYYDSIYNFLIKDMKPAEVCALIGICGKPKDVPIAPLVTKEIVVKANKLKSKNMLIGAEEAKIARIPQTKQTNVRIMDSQPAPLPIERMMVSMPQSKPVCSFCQYFLHYLQVELSNTNNEDKIRTAVDQACSRLPNSVEAECKQFVEQYGPAVIALLVQEIDPASVCPALGLCPSTGEVKRVTVNEDKSNCPLCLFAVEQLETMLKNNRSEASIRKALDGLCSHLSQKLRTECIDFVDTYSTQLVEMLIADLNAQEICVYLKLCKDETADPLKVTHGAIDQYFEKPSRRSDRNNRKKPMLPKHMLEGGDIETNEIPDNTVNGQEVRVTQKPTCVICEFVMKEIDDEIKDKHTEDEVKQIVHKVCRRMPKSVRSQCDQFVDKYADLIISLLSQDLDPSTVCQELKLCDPSDGLQLLDAAREEILDCAVCETVVMAVKKVITNDRVDRNIVHIVEKSCGLLPAKYSARCHTMMEIYGDSVIHLIEEYGTKSVCQKIGLCAARTDQQRVRMFGGGL